MWGLEGRIDPELLDLVAKNWETNASPSHYRACPCLHFLLAVDLRIDSNSVVKQLP